MRTGRPLAALLIGVLAALCLPAPASAHASLLSTNPAAGNVLQTAPTEVVLTFSEPVSAVKERIRITAPDGSRADTGNATVRDKALVIPVRDGGPRGTYLVSYRVISVDSHGISGGFTYSVGEVTATAGEPAFSGSRTEPSLAVAIGVAKYLGYAGLVLIAGPVLVLLMLWPRRLDRKLPARMIAGGVGLVALSTLLGLYLQIPYTAGEGIFGASGESARAVFGSTFGAAYMVRLAVLGALAVLLRPVVTGTAGTADKALLVILGVVAAATWPISGHPAGTPVPTITVIADAAHLAAMAVWVGGLVMLFAVLLRQASDTELRAILPVWSGWAMLAVTVLVLSGTAQALVEVASFGALFGTTYGRLVLVKVGLLALLIGVAAVSRRVVLRGFAPAEAEGAPETAGGRPESAGGASGTARSRLRMGVVAEVAIAAVVIGFTAALVQTTPARTAEANENRPAQTTYTAVLTSPLYRLEVNIEPARTGPNTLHLYAYTPEGAPLTIVEWKGSAALPSAGVEPIDIALLPITREHSIGQLLLPTAGTWELRFTLRTTDIDQASVTAKVPIR